MWLRAALGHDPRTGAWKRVPVQQRGRGLPVYEVTCLYPDLKQSLPLGDLDSARAICNSCVATGVFRPDED